MKWVGSYGQTEVYKWNEANYPVLSIHHAGNMGASVDRVEKNFEKMLGVSLNDWLKTVIVIDDHEEGSPDYLYERNITYKRRI